MIQAQDTIPAVELQIMGDSGPETVNSAELCKDKKVVLFAVPGAFTPTCSAAHLPGFAASAEALKAKGVDSIICTSVNDVFVMHAWGLANGSEDVVMLADGNGEFAEALGLTMDASGFKMGSLRSKRYAMIIENGVVQHVAVDNKGLDLSSVEAILAKL
ncbi:peroxiredoxin [Pseudoteredinibacter isoporae]|uniref:Glutathione-dependent peroxiredoxin n=1 Tax=Pseudoteredinibacter isoporae TaxID=570281 RepID=A0A7X0JUZ0_9GAMM|nr:peroxiredoxin [Pseudoteredinibacter isoporae]MBB6522759.1 peroxiredoxin [Pseudoteredinibacter isoporae]NHO88287.1 peroxiredoxin [Pseudoteredinibacter isoporae]NIB23382.1 peroxiredoxin [Pseudoteredinibacter isoporae]